jgi:hypothetical protein
LARKVAELLLALAAPSAASPQHLLRPCRLLPELLQYLQRQPTKPDCSGVEAGTPLWHMHL